MIQFLVSLVTFIIAHLADIAIAVSSIGGLILASGWVKNRRAQEIIAQAVAYAEQYKKRNNSENRTAKARALEYAQEYLPGTNTAVLSEQIEAAVATFNAQRAKAPQPRGSDGKFTSANTNTK